MEQNIAGIKEAKCFECNRSEFLPFKCDDCKNLFCDEHKRQEAHNCKCQNQKKRDFSSNSQSVEKLKCTQCKTTLNNINKNQCKQCNKYFCTKHRLFETHNCEQFKNKMNKENQVNINQIKINQKKEIKTKQKKEKKSFFFCCIQTNK